MDLMKNGAWLNEPEGHVWDGADLTVDIERTCDFFIRPDGTHFDDASLCFAAVVGDFTASVRVQPDLKHDFDAGGLMIRHSADQWGKVGVERSPAGEVSIVSVVTDRKPSDDNNNELVANPDHYVRVTRKGSNFGFHHSDDGRVWRFVRSFAISVPDEILLGLFAQAPRVAGCSVRFLSFHFVDAAVADFRSGQ